MTQIYLKVYCQESPLYKQFDNFPIYTVVYNYPFFYLFKYDENFYL